MNKNILLIILSLCLVSTVSAYITQNELCNNGDAGVPYVNGTVVGYECLDIPNANFNTVNANTIVAEEYYTNTPKDKRDKSTKEAETKSITEAYNSGDLRDKEGTLFMIPEIAQPKIANAHWSLTGLLDWVYENLVSIISRLDKEKECLANSKDFNNYKKCMGYLE